VIVSEFQAEADGAFESNFFWRRALTAAVAAELTSTLVGKRNEDIFVTALLQDIGIMVMSSCCPQTYQLVFQDRKQHTTPLCEAERRVFGFDHQELGAEVLRSWQLPEEIYAPIRNHHCYDAVSDDYREEREILCIADRLSSFYNGNQDVDKIRQAKRILDMNFGMRGDAVEALVEAVAAKTIEVLSSFEIAPGAMRPFSLILQEANQELSSLYDSYELLVIELKQAKEKAEKLAQELRDANDIHRELAFRDGLTGIYNRRFFQEALDLEITRVHRYNRQFSMIIFDLDSFKQINDDYGHTIGDLVLINICKTVHETVRATDVVARYGGDEFVIILPETDIASARAIAEKMRSAVEALTTRVDDTVIRGTISIGLTSYCSAFGNRSREEVISMADKALYIAKHSGKNSVRALQFHEK
jgi:diguanylate cyclase (GGDEF)-like protein